MDEVLRYFSEYEFWIYLVLGGWALWQIRQFVLSWEELRSSAFGMERASAQSRLNQAATMLLLILVMASAEFYLVSFVVPAVPGANPLPTPTLNMLATATAELPDVTPDAQVNSTQLPPAGLPAEQGCIPGRVMLTEPKNGDQVSDVVTIMGSANIENFGFYKYEIARPGETIWLSINAGETPVDEGVLGEWVTSVLSPGEYLLRLVVVDNQGNTLPACVIQVRVVETE